MCLVVGFNGHGQHARRNTGVGKLLATIEACNCGYEPWLFTWRHNSKTLAVWLHNSRPNRRIVLIGFSYGGYTAVLLARELEKLGVDIDHMYLIDAVARPRPRVGSFRSLMDLCWWIKVPHNVKQLTNWRQSVSRPSGHKVVADFRYTKHDPYTLYVPHTQMDDHARVHATILADLC